MKNLVRLQVGDFKLEESITTNELIENINDLEYINKNIITIEQFFGNKKQIDLEKIKSSKNKNTSISEYLNGVNLKVELPDDVYRVYYENKFTGLGVVKNNFLKRDIVI